jgi:hypothetical protein
MQDVEDLLRTLPRSVTPGPAGPETAAADVARGHRALARRRRGRLAGLAGGVAVVAGVAVAFTVPTQPGGSPRPAAASAGVTGTAHGLTLVAYTGAQPEGFKVSTVPSGWHVVASNDSSFVVAPPGAATDPGTDGGISFIGRIAVMLQGDSTLDPSAKVTAVTVNGQPGKLTLSKDSNPQLSFWQLFYPDAQGHRVQVQVPESLGLSKAQIVSFAAGITVTAAAQPGLG